MIFDEVPTTVRAGAMVFSGGAGDDGFFIEKWKGWGPVATKRSITKRSNAAGSFPTQGYPDDRTLIFSGRCHANGAERMGWFENQFSGLFMDGLGGRVLVEHGGYVTWAYGFRADQPDFESEIPGSTSTYQLGLWFPDPRKFGLITPDQIFSGPHGVNIITQNDGNYEARPVMTVSGNMPGGYLVNGPNALGYGVTHAVVPGHPHVIDMNDGSLTIDGVRIYGATPINADTWGVPPAGQAVQILHPASGTGNLSIAVPPTYI
ncbi:hypothetical protein [Subtercola sp. YIM 133946]|uniref:hypothetical protein n=1 Tax=Subtercola sp. YIM 133946 TaxID=3118909 RepID=UPI002F95C941